MEYKNVLVAYDESQTAKNAINTALGIIDGDPDAKLTVLYVCASRDVDEESFNFAAARAGVQEISSAEYAKIQKEYIAQQLELLKKDVSGLVQGHDNHIVCHIGQGKPAKAIVDYAEKRGCDLIVMGSRGLNAVRGMLGSVSYAVLRAASMPVLIVK